MPTASSEARPDARPRSRGLLPGAVAVAGAALVLLLVWTPAFDVERLHVRHPFGDQAGYVTTARTWVDTGHLRSGIVYPAHAGEPDWRPYMPGHYAALAASYAVLGYGVLASLLPNLVAHALGGVLVFLAACRLHGRGAGYAAAGAFLLFPPALAYAFTAMAESTFLAACAAALAAVALAPPRARPLVLPLALALPFLFRETGALYVLPAAALLVSGGGSRSRVAASVVGAVLLLLALNAWQIADGKGAAPLEWVTAGGFNYTDAMAEQPSLSPGQWASALFDNALRNLRQHAGGLRHSPDVNGTVGGTALILAGLAALVVGIRRRRAELLPLATGLLCLTALGLVYFLYDVRGQKGMRSLLFTLPATCVALAGPLARAWASGRGARTALGLAGGAALVGSAWLTLSFARQLTRPDAPTDACLGALEDLRHDDTRLLLAPGDMLARYAVERYPVPAGFPPANDATLKLLERRWEVGTLIVSQRLLGSRLTKGQFFLESLPPFRKRFDCGGQTYAVYQRR